MTASSIVSPVSYLLHVLPVLNEQRMLQAIRVSFQLHSNYSTMVRWQTKRLYKIDSDRWDHGCRLPRDLLCSDQGVIRHDSQLSAGTF